MWRLGAKAWATNLGDATADFGASSKYSNEKIAEPHYEKVPHGVFSLSHSCIASCWRKNVGKESRHLDLSPLII